MRTWHATSLPAGGIPGIQIKKICLICGDLRETHHHPRETRPYSNGDNTLITNALCGRGMLCPYRQVISISYPKPLAV